MGLRLNNSSSNYVELVAPSSIASDVTLTLPNTDGDSGQYLQTNGSGALTWATVADNNTFGFTSLGETATTSGSGSTVTGIPSTATEVIIIMTDISCSNSTAPHILLQLGDGSIDTSNNYIWSLVYGSSYQAFSSKQPHIRIINTGATGTGNKYSGIIRIVPGTSNIQGTFTTHYQGATPNVGTFQYTGGTTLDRVSLSSASVFDAGKYEVLHNG